jgi:hypothetical protein
MMAANRKHDAPAALDIGALVMQGGERVAEMVNWRVAGRSPRFALVMWEDGDSKAHAVTFPTDPELGAALVALISGRH